MCTKSKQYKRGTYARVLVVDFSSAFNTIVPALLLTKLCQLSVCEPLCLWINNFLTDRRYCVKLGKSASSTLTIGTGAPQGWVPPPPSSTFCTPSMSNCISRGCSPAHFSDFCWFLSNLNLIIFLFLLILFKGQQGANSKSLCMLAYLDVNLVMMIYENFRIRKK